MNNARFLARKTALWESAYLSSDFCYDLKIRDSKGKFRKFYKILWDYIPDSDPEVLTWAGKKIGQIAKKIRAELILGVESSGIPVATSASMYSSLPFGFIRKSPKGYGLERVIEGEFGKRKRVLLVDNFVFTGTTMANAAKTLDGAGFKLAKAISIDDFNTLPKDPSFEKLSFESLAKNSEKIEELLRLGYFPLETVEILRKYVNTPELFFAPSSIHDKFVKVLSKLPSQKCIVAANDKAKGKPPGLRSRIYRRLLKTISNPP